MPNKSDYPKYLPDDFKNNSRHNPKIKNLINRNKNLKEWCAENKGDILLEFIKVNSREWLDNYCRSLNDGSYTGVTFDKYRVFRVIEVQYEKKIEQIISFFERMNGRELKESEYEEFVFGLFNLSIESIINCGREQNAQQK